MKTEVILLQNYDNYDSLLDKLRQITQSESCGERFLLVWSKREAVLSEIREFTALRNWLRRRGYPLAIVTTHERIRNLAAAAGIPVFEDRESAETGDWKTEDSQRVPSPLKRAGTRAELKKLLIENESANLPKGISLGLCFVLILLAAAAALLFLPRATVTLTPTRITQEKRFTLWTSPSLESVTITGGIPYTEKKHEFTYSVTVPATDRISNPGELASGEILVQNLCEKSFTIRNGDIVRAEESGLQFQSLTSARLNKGETVSVSIEAADAGTAYNLAPDAKLGFEKDSESCLDITRPQALSGGTDGFHPTPGESDRKQAAAQITELALAEIRNDPERVLGTDETLLFPDDIVFEVVSEEQTPDFGYASDTLTLRQTLRTTLKTVRKSQVTQLLRALLSENEGRSILSVNGFSDASEPVEENGIIRWDAGISYEVYESETNEKALQYLLRGKAVGDVPEILKIIPHEGTPDIRVFPENFPWMPLIPEQIRIRIR